MGFSNLNDHSIMADSFNSKKLRPLTPRPSIIATTTNTTTTSSCSTPTHGSDFFFLQDHLGTQEQGKRQLDDHPASSRWNPTPEQLQVLEDLYRRGTHTPSADQIRSIAAQLRRFGKIEGKNVFYWFQNHRARDRQKRRRQTEVAAVMGECNVEILERKDSGLSAREFQVAGCKSCFSATNYNINVEESASIYQAESRMDEWFQHNRELKLQNLPEMHATCHVASFSSPLHLMNTNNCNPSTTSAGATALSTPKILIDNDFNDGDDDDDDDEWGQSQTLDLFPIRSNGSIFEEKTQAQAQAQAQARVTQTMMNLSPYHFIEFL